MSDMDKKKKEIHLQIVHANIDNNTEYTVEWLTEYMGGGIFS